MSCNDGHLFKPFPRSRDLFCSACGLTMANTPAPLYDVRGPWRPGDPPQQAARPEDPDRDAALSILRANQHPPNVQATFEENLDALFEKYALPEDVMQDLYNEALKFGPGLDLRNFEESTLIPLSQVVRPPTDAEELSELLGDR